MDMTNGARRPSARSTGSLISYETGVAVAHGLFNAQQRGTLIVDPGDKGLRGGMVVGTALPAGTSRQCIWKPSISHTRASGSDDALRLITSVQIQFGRKVWNF